MNVCYYHEPSFLAFLLPLTVDVQAQFLSMELNCAKLNMTHHTGQQAFVLSFSCPSEDTASILRQFGSVLRCVRNL